jgi:hypothetical protein
MNRGASAFGFIAGLCSGILNLTCALLVLENAIVALAYVPQPALLAAAAALLAVAGVNFAGGCACYRRRIAGGILMLSGAVPLLLIGVACLYLSLSSPNFFRSVIGAEFGEEVRRTAAGAGAFLIAVQLVSLAAALSCLVPQRTAKQKVIP